MQSEAGAPLTGDMDPDTHDDGTASDPGDARVDPARRHRLFGLLALVAVVSLALDQGSKAWALRALGDGMPRPLLGDFLQLRLIGNSGAAFSLASGNTWVLTLIALAVLVAIVAVSRRLGSRGWAWTLGLLLGGAVGNLIDRLVRPPSFGQGHVVDFIDYNGWFIGNVADIWIVVAAAFVIWLSFRGVGVDGRRQQ